jgi:Ca2+/H+ antiporter
MGKKNDFATGKETDRKNDFALGKENFTLMAIAMLIVIVGFCLMLGGATTEETGFNPDIFSKRRIVVAPAVTMFGFVLVVVAILKKNKPSR